MAQRPHPGVRTAIGVLGVVGALLAALAPSTAASASAGSGTGSSSVSVTAVLDHSSRSAVRDLYTNVLKPALAVPIGWTGDVDACVAGAPSAAAQAATLDAVNYYRTMADQPPVTFDPELDALAQAGALLSTANGVITHDPPPKSKCYSADAKNGATHSNLAQGASGAAAIAKYMAEPDNTFVVNRRWVLYPREVTMGSGSTATYNALYVLGPVGPRPASATPWSPWPSAGYFPAQIEPNGRWSISYAAANFANATVTVKRGSTPLAVTLRTPTGGYGDNTLVWDVAPGFTLGGPDQLYTVNVAGVVPSGTSTPVSTTYTVRLFDANLETPTVPTAVDAKPGLGSATVTWGAPTSDGGSPITSYLVVASPSNKFCQWTGGPLTCTVTGLANGTPQTFTVRAQTAIGIGATSAPTAAVTPGDSCGPDGAGPFIDVAGTHVFCADIEWLALQGVTSGYPDGTFLPSAPVTRQSMAAFLYRLAGSPAFTPPAVPTFTDVPISHPFRTEVEWLASMNITHGYPDGSFGATLVVTRQSMAAFLYRFGESPEFTPPAVPSFVDVPTTHAFFKEIEWMSSEGIAGGFSDQTYRPATAVSRQATAAFLHRFSNL